jgi:cytochrome bd-type quinol oxidase subunit 2
MDLPLIFAFVAAAAVGLYVLADGFDLGIGLLFLLAPREQDRAVMIESIAPLWDGNETWLVFGAALLWTAFPIAYYVLLPAFYLPLMIMVFALVFRGIFRIPLPGQAVPVGLGLCLRGRHASCGAGAGPRARRFHRRRAGR